MTLTAEKAKALREKGQVKNLKKRNSLAKKDIKNIFKIIEHHARRGEDNVYIDSSNICIYLKTLFDDYDLANILESNGYKFDYQDGGYTGPLRLRIEW